MSEAETLIEAGYEARRRGDSASAGKMFDRALKMGRAGGASLVVARALTGRGQAERDQGRTENALAAYEEAVSIFREVGDRAGLADGLRHVADVARKLGRLEAALRLGTEAVTIQRGVGGGPLDLANALRVVALTMEGLEVDAGAVWREAQELYLAAGVGAGVAECEAHLQ